MNPQGQYPPNAPYGGQPQQPGYGQPGHVQPWNPSGYRQQPPPPPMPPRTDNSGQIAAIVGFVFLILLLVGGEIAERVGGHKSGHTSIVVGPTVALEPGVTWHKVDMPGGDGTRTLWIYLPTDTTGGKLPCVFIAPAGSPCFAGMTLAEGDRPEHLPYVRAGYAVVAYTLDGPLEDLSNGSKAIDAIGAFRDAHAGVDDEKAAVDYALANLPQIDSSKLYVAGHSSAGTMALLAAEHDRRITGCIAYAPQCDVRGQLDKDDVDALSSRIDGFESFLDTCSPMPQAASIHCPVFIFHADDDDTVSSDSVDAFVDKLKATDSNVTYCRAPVGGHYDSMIQVGVPQAITWLQAGMPTTPDLSVNGADGTAAGSISLDPPNPSP